MAFPDAINSFGKSPHPSSTPLDIETSLLTLVLYSEPPLTLTSWWPIQIVHFFPMQSLWFPFLSCTNTRTALYFKRKLFFDVLYIYLCQQYSHILPNPTDVNVTAASWSNRTSMREEHRPTAATTRIRNEIYTVLMAELFPDLISSNGKQWQK